MEWEIFYACPKRIDKRGYGTFHDYDACKTFHGFISIGTAVAIILRSCGVAYYALDLPEFNFLT